MPKSPKKNQDLAPGTDRVPATDSVRGVSPEFAAILREKERVGNSLYDMKLKKTLASVSAAQKRSSWLKDAIAMCLELERRHPTKSKVWRYQTIAAKFELTEKTVARALDRKMPGR